MTSTMRIAAAVVAAVFLATPAAWADDKKAKKADTSQSQPAASPGAAPPQFEGEVQSIDLERGMMSVRFQDGSVQEFKGNKETLKDYKVGDKIEGKLRR
ncbi:MAG: hypothetical protein HYU41_26560 [Candidatus Rokubacteria bacterium]|nr:hypothetical protein [Candidatus Rokubacteria bacterium]